MSLIALLVFLGCYLGVNSSYIVRFPKLGMGVLFPPYAVLAAALMLTTARHWWLYLLAGGLGMLAAHLQHGLVSYVALTEIANITRALVAAWGVRWICGRAGLFDTLPDTIAFLMFAVVLAPATGALVGAFSVTLRDPAANFAATWQAWLLSNMLGGATLLPLTLILLTRARQSLKNFSPARVIEAIVLTLAMFAVGARVFTIDHVESIAPASLYWPLPFLLWAAVRFGPGGTIAALSGLSALVIAGAIQGRGPFVSQSPAENLIQLQFFLIALCAPLLLLAVIVQQQAKTAAALLQTQSDYRNVVEDQTELICRFLPDGTLTFVNGAYCRYFNCTQEQLVGSQFWDFIPPESQKVTRDCLASISVQNAVAIVEHEVLVPGGALRWQHWTNRGLFDRFNQIIAFQSVGRDVTERKIAEEQHRQYEMEKEVAAVLKASEARFRQLADAMPQIVWTASADGSPEYFNQKGYALIGATEGPAGHQNWIDALHPEDRQPCLHRWYRCTATGQPFQMEFRIRQIREPAEYRWYLARALPVRNEAGKVLRWYGTCTDVHDHRMAEESLRISESRLREANRAKDHFLAALSHELRTPLTPVMLAAAAHIHDHGLSEELANDLHTIYVNTAMEVALIDDLLDLTRVGHGKIDLKKERIDVHAMLQQTATTCADESFQSKSLRISLELVATSHWVLADSTRLTQVFWNIIKNAVKFSNPGDIITIRTADGADKSLIIEFIDTGRGIEPADLPRIFDPFEQGNPQTTRTFGGLGLGLALSKSFVDLHGGRISATSPGRGHGATIRVELPALLSADLAPVPFLSTPQAAALLSPNQTAPAVQPAPRILVVEDHPHTADLLTRLLRSMGYQVHYARNIADALAAAAKIELDIVISDLGLPDGTGLELMAQLSRNDRLRGIALSGFGMVEDIQRSLAAGFVEHLVKPVQIERVQEAITRAMAMKNSPCPTPLG